MAINVARMSDLCDGICCVEDPKTHPATGTIILGSPTVYSDGLMVARLGDLVITDDSHKSQGTIIEGSPTVYANGLNVARIGDTFDGCFSGVILGYSPTVMA